MSFLYWISLVVFLISTSVYLLIENPEINRIAQVVAGVSAVLCAISLLWMGGLP